MFDVKFPLLCTDIVQAIALKPISGLLLYGPPGCGKPTLAYAIANENGVPFYMISAPELVSGVSGMTSYLSFIFVFNVLVGFILNWPFLVLGGS